MGSFHAAPQEFEKALDLIVKRAVDVKSLITSSMRLEDLPRAFEILSTSRSELKIAVTP